MNSSAHLDARGRIASVAAAEVIGHFGAWPRASGG